MKKLAHTTAVIALITSAVFAASALGGATAASKRVAFKGTYAGTVTERVSGQDVTAVAKGTGKGTVLGKSTIGGTVKGTTANPPCSPFGGPGLMKSKKGTLKVNVVNSRGCAASEEDRDNISIAGTVKVKSGTGKLKKAKGSFHFSGRYDRKGGTFSVKLKGSLRY